MKSKFFRISSYAVFAAMVALSFTGCGSSSSSSTPAAPVPPTVQVKDTSGAPVEGATVYAIPAADVAAIAAQPITLGTDGNYTAAAKTVDEPLEDLINGNYTPTGGGVGTYKSAVTDAEGKAVLADLATGETDSYFIYVKLAAADSGHLPGGSLCRTSVTGASLDNEITAVEVSTTQSAGAVYVGSSSCIGCHSSYTTEKQTLHKLGIMTPATPSGLQDLAAFSAFNKALSEEFVTGTTTAAGTPGTGGTAIYFSDANGTRKFDKFKTSKTAAGTVYATVRIYKDATDNKYRAEFTNVINPGDPNSPQTHEIAMTYGGGLYKQRYMTKVGSSLYMIPLQYNTAGSESSTARTRKVWRDYHLDWWVNGIFGAGQFNAATGAPTTPAAMTFKTIPAAANSFDVQCAPCHYNGYSVAVVTGASGTQYVASAAMDANGELHPVAGTNQEMNIGCETCHGPGSEHVAAGGAGKFIVSPSNITPERATVICAQCHSRPQGNDSLGIKKDSPLNQQNKMMAAGTSRADFLAQNTSRHDASVSAGDFWGDGKHSKSHHQQYTDFIQTKKYRNGDSLKTCASCHNPHAPGSDKHQLSGTSDNSLCTSCHATVEVVAHMTAKTGASMGSGTKCIDCHTTKTSSSGAGTNATTAKTHSANTLIKYFQGDISSHRFDVPLKSGATPTSDPMPVPYTNNCGSCHNMSTLPL